MSRHANTSSRSWLGAGMVAFLTAALALPALAVAGSRRSATFEGSCQLLGRTVHDPPLTNSSRPTRAIARGRGRCSGTFTDARGREHRLEDERVKDLTKTRGDLSCAGGRVTGRGYLAIRGHRLRFAFSELRGPGATVLGFEGHDGGSATGEARISDKEDPAELLRRCAGNGLRSVHIDFSLTTTPEISG